MSNPTNTAEALKTAAGGTVQAAPAPAVAETKTQTPTPDLSKLLLDVLELQKKVAAKDIKGAEVQAAKKPDIDWSKISESDIINFDLSIPVIEQEMPSYMDVHLKDLNYISRWIHITPARLGMCLAQGYTYVEQADLDDRYPHPLAFDGSGHYAFGDVVCLRILKSRYYPALKANYVKTMAIHGRQQMLAKLGRSINNDDQLAASIHRGGQTLYEPTDMKGTEITKEMFSSL